MFNKPTNELHPYIPFISLQFNIVDHHGNKCILSYKDAWRVAWFHLNKHSKQSFIQLPNFDPKIFEEITGLKEGIDY